MRLIVFTSASVGFASYCLAALAQSPRLRVALVVRELGVPQRPWRRRWRKFKKTLRIGPLGALNGLRMRRWYDLSERLKLEPVEDVARRHGVPLETTPSMFAPRTVELCRAADADVGVSLGTGFIPRRVFAVPKLGSINIHHEVVPHFRGAQSVIWQIHQGSARTGYTIHRIDDRIDTGDVLYQEEMDIQFQPTLELTVQENYARLWEASRAALVKVLENFEQYAAAARPQGAGAHFTTPSYWQFRRIVRRHEELRLRQAPSPPPQGGST